MAHFAKVENGIVTEVIVADQEVIDTGLFGSGWIQTSYNTYGNQHPDGRPLRKNFALVGGFYDPEADAFYGPSPFPSWSLDPETYLWEAPVPRPSDGKYYVWKEASQEWVLGSVPDVPE